MESSARIRGESIETRPSHSCTSQQESRRALLLSAPSENFSRLSGGTSTFGIVMRDGVYGRICGWCCLMGASILG